MGNGSAMRIAPLGAWFADAKNEEIVRQATLSAAPTHQHPEGVAGAIALALGAAAAARGEGGRALLEIACRGCPPSQTREGIIKALGLSLNRKIPEAVKILGNGSRVLTLDTVPYALWCAARHSDSLEEALWNTASGFGDMDTTCAMVGGIVILSAGAESAPQIWWEAREGLPL